MKTPEQLAELQWSFDQNCFVTAVERQRLIHATGLSSEQIGKWFEHRRAARRQEYLDRGMDVPAALVNPPPRPIGGSRRARAPAPAQAQAQAHAAPRMNSPSSCAAASTATKKRVKEMIQLIKKKSLSEDQFLELTAEWSRLTRRDTVVPTAVPAAEVLEQLSRITGLDVPLVALWFERRIDRLRRQAHRLAEVSASTTATATSDNEDAADEFSDTEVEAPSSGSKHLTPQQRDKLESAFLANMYPKPDALRRLASFTGLHIDRIKNWFCARRARARKEGSTTTMMSTGMRSVPSCDSLIADSEHSSMTSSSLEDVPRRPDRYSAETLAVLVDAFNRPPYGFISAEEKTELAAMLGLTEKQVKTWFTGERTRRRRQGELIEPPLATASCMAVPPPPPPPLPPASSCAFAAAAAAAAAAVSASSSSMMMMTNVYYHMVPAAPVALSSSSSYEEPACGKRVRHLEEQEEAEVLAAQQMVEEAMSEHVSESESAPDTPVAEPVRKRARRDLSLPPSVFGDLAASSAGDMMMASLRTPTLLTAPMSSGLSRGGSFPLSSPTLFGLSGASSLPEYNQLPPSFFIDEDMTVCLPPVSSFDLV